MKTREMGSPGFHQSLAAHQAVVPPSRVDSSIVEVVEGQTAAPWPKAAGGTTV
ncbi:hypothetical protein [Streptomyces sp. NPDC014006]|uniref:hypothetical protein n=1 Tax=Streptomyces sp. NPDC014006 TaxID=3364870 RepID=UPI0036F63875